MLEPAFVQHLEEALSERLNTSITIDQVSAATGGCINQAYQLHAAQSSWFLKRNSATCEDMFAAEMDGLATLAEATAFRIPTPLFYGRFGSYSYLVMEYLALEGRVQDVAFATALRGMHEIHQSRYGYHRDNYIGASAQFNNMHDNWFDFFMQERLERQVRMLTDMGNGRELQRIWPDFNRACEALFADYQPKASLLHGDLWQGNVGQVGGIPSIYDPACYYGDAETDLAMLELFGHPSNQFYETYDKGREIAPGREIRKHCYNLYHILNHANLFGGGYLSQANGLIKDIISAIIR